MQAAKEHFDKLKEDYQAQVEKLTNLVDGSVDTCDFLKVSGTEMLYVRNVFVVSRVMMSCANLVFLPWLISI
jgi:hypothetical protein